MKWWWWWKIWNIFLIFFSVARSFSSLLNALFSVLNFTFLVHSFPLQIPFLFRKFFPNFFTVSLVIWKLVWVRDEARGIRGSGIQSCDDRYLSQAQVTGPVKRSPVTGRHLLTGHLLTCDCSWTALCGIKKSLGCCWKAMNNQTPNLACGRRR